MYTRNHASVRQAAIETARTWVTRDFVILDTETTGLYSPARIVEISCIDREGNVLVDSLVNPGIPIPADASAIHGISDADVADRPSFSDLWPLVWDAVRSADCVLIYNASYDCPFTTPIPGGSRGCPGSSRATHLRMHHGTLRPVLRAIQRVSWFLYVAETGKRRRSMRPAYGWNSTPGPCRYPGILSSSQIFGIDGRLSAKLVITYAVARLTNPEPHLAW